MARLFICASLMCFTFSLAGQSLTSIKDEDSVYVLHKTASFMEDPSTSVMLSEILKDTVRYSFIPGRETLVNFGTTRSAIWCKFILANYTDQRCFLVIEQPLIQHITVFSLQPDGSYSSVIFGALHRRDQNTGSNFFTYRLLEPSATTPTTFYIRFSGNQTLDLGMKVMTTETLLKEQQKKIIIFGLMTGFLLAMLIYNLFVYFSIRAKPYLFYIMYLAILIVTTDITFFGVGFQYLWPTMPEINQYLNAFVTLAFIVLMLFASSLLNTAKNIPLLHRGMYLLYSVHIVNLVLFASGKFLLANLAVEVSGMITSIYMTIVGVTCWHKRVSGAKYYVVGWTVALTFISLFALYLSGLLPTNNFIVNAPLFGNCFEVALFSFALTARIKTLRNEKEKIQYENLLIIQSQNETLEKLVEQRTEEIAAQNEELEKRNQNLERASVIIEDQNNRLTLYNRNLKAEVENRNEGLLNSNRELAEKNNQLEQFAFIAAHNLRSPVARIKGLGNILDLMDQDDPEKKFVIEKIIESTVKLDQALHDLTAILDFKKGLGQFEIVSLPDSLEKVLEMLKTEIDNSHAKIICNFSSSSNINSIPQYIESIFYNLISNAIKYKSPERIPEIDIQSKCHSGNVIEITIHDNGLGLDLEQYGNKVFSIYQRFHSHVEGKGLGLHMVKIQVEALKGTVKVFSKLNEGTTFQISIPN